MKIVYQSTDGVSIISPAKGADIDMVINSAVPAGAKYLVVDDLDVPTDRTYRDAWVMDVNAPGGIAIDGQKKAAIDAEREERDMLRLFMRALPKICRIIIDTKAGKRKAPSIAELIAEIPPLED